LGAHSHTNLNGLKGTIPDCYRKAAVRCMPYFPCNTSLNLHLNRINKDGMIKSIVLVKFLVLERKNALINQMIRTLSHLLS